MVKARLLLRVLCGEICDTLVERSIACISQYQF